MYTIIEHTNDSSDHTNELEEFDALIDAQDCFELIVLSWDYSDGSSLELVDENYNTLDYHSF
jgi:hypothetical protein